MLKKCGSKLIWQFEPNKTQIDLKSNNADQDDQQNNVVFTIMETTYLDKKEMKWCRWLSLDQTKTQNHFYVIDEEERKVEKDR